MIDKMKNLSNVVIIIFFVISIIFIIVINIMNLFKVSNGVNVDATVINNYTSLTIASPTSEQLTNVVKDYNIFLSLQSAVENYTQYLIDGKYSTTYDILTKDITKVYSKKEYETKIKAYYLDNFVTKDENLIYVNSSNLVRAYKVAENTYLCEINNSSNKSILIGVYLDSVRQQYKIFYLNI